MTDKNTMTGWYRVTGSDFDYQKPNDRQRKTIEEFNAQWREIAENIRQSVPDCRERSLALTKLEETRMWLNKAIVFYTRAGDE